MQAPIAIDYTRDGDDWKVTARRSDELLQATAPGLIAARDKADQLIEQLARDDEEKTVVHLLDGDAFAFTEAYLHARLDKTGANGSYPPAAGEQPDRSPDTPGAGGGSVTTASPAEDTSSAQNTGSDEAPRASSA